MRLATGAMIGAIVVVGEVAKEGAIAKMTGAIATRTGAIAKRTGAFAKRTGAIAKEVMQVWLGSLWPWWPLAARWTRRAGFIWLGGVALTLVQHPSPTMRLAMGAMMGTIAVVGVVVVVGEVAKEGSVAKTIGQIAQEVMKVRLWWAGGASVVVGMRTPRSWRAITTQKASQEATPGWFGRHGSSGCWGTVFASAARVVRTCLTAGQRYRENEHSLDNR